MLFRKVLIFRVFEDTHDLEDDINIPDVEKTLSDDAEVVRTQNVLRASSPSLVFIRHWNSLLMLGQGGRDRYHCRNQDKSCFEKT